MKGPGSVVVVRGALILSENGSENEGITGDVT